MTTELESGAGFGRFRFLELSEKGLFLDDDGREVAPRGTRSFVAERMRVPKGTTDVFLWVHGWRNDRKTARRTAARLFASIETVRAVHRDLYPQIEPFRPVYAAVHWPSWSNPSREGYSRIRERAHQMTESGTAEFVLAEILGFLEEEQPADRRRLPGILQARGGHYVHCVGHSFGGRFLCEAVAAAAEPSLPTLSLRPGTSPWSYTVDTLLVFQMAAPPDVFDGRLRALLGGAPLSGPVCLTRSDHDRALCLWHRKAEGVKGIGCVGAFARGEGVQNLLLKRRSEPYTRDDLAHTLVNVDASWLYRRGRLKLQGAHSDFWYEESIHLLLSLVAFSR